MAAVQPSSPLSAARATIAMESAAVLSSSLDSIGASMSQWVPDSERKECGDCCQLFSPFIRRHHCRSCGEIFCANCSRRFLLLPKYKLNGYDQPQRTCNTCVELHGPSSLQSVGTVEHRLPVWDLPMVVSKKLPMAMNGELMEVGEYVLRVCSSSKVAVSFVLSQAVESEDDLTDWEKRIARGRATLDVNVEMNGKDMCDERYFTIVAPSTWSLSVTFPAAFASANVTVTILKSCTCEMSAHFRDNREKSPRRNRGLPRLTSGLSAFSSPELYSDARAGLPRIRSASGIETKKSEGEELEMKELTVRRRTQSEKESKRESEEGKSARVGEECGDCHNAREQLEENVAEQPLLEDDEELKDWGFHTVDREALVAEYGREALRKELSVRCIPMKAVKTDTFADSCAAWPAYEGHTALTYPQDQAKKALSTWSLFGEQCFELGLIRPFLLLVSMHPEVRLSYAQLLEVPIWEMDGFGDPHFEAYAMLVRDSNSVTHRANCAFEEAGDWFQMLWRIASQSLASKRETCPETRSELSSLSTSYAESLGYCKEPENPYLRSLEEVFLKGLVQVFDEVKETGDTCHTVNDETRLLMESDCLDPLVAKLKAAGFADPWLTRRLATATFQGRNDHIASALGEWCEQKQFYQGARQVASLVVPGSILLVHLLIAATPLFTLSPLAIIPATSLAVNVVRLALFTKTPFSILLPVIGIVCQRELLAYHDICIDDYYPRSHTPC